MSDRPKRLAVLLASLDAQTFREWDCIVLHQRKGRATYQPVLNGRVQHRIVPYHGDWGQTVKMQAVPDAQGTWVGFPNDDAYYAPAYLERMVDAGRHQKADLVYCDWACWQFYEGAPVTGRIDVGGFLVKRDRMLKHGWPDKGPTGDGTLVESLVANGAKAVRVPHVLYMKD